MPAGVATSDLGAVQGFLAGNADAPVQIDASRLRVLDARLSELLLCAARHGRTRGVALGLVGLSQRHRARLQRLAVPTDVLPAGGAG